MCQTPFKAISKVKSLYQEDYWNILPVSGPSIDHAFYDVTHHFVPCDKILTPLLLTSNVRVFLSISSGFPLWNSYSYIQGYACYRQARFHVRFVPCVFASAGKHSAVEFTVSSDRRSPHNSNCMNRMLVILPYSLLQGRLQIMKGSFPNGLQVAI